MAPRIWRRPFTSIYNDNYKYGNSLYSSAIDDIEKRYHSSISRTAFRSDRADLGLSTFSSSSIGAAVGSSTAATSALQETSYASASLPQPRTYAVPDPEPVYSTLPRVRSSSPAGRHFDADLDFALRKARSVMDFGSFRRAGRSSSPAFKFSSFSEDEEGSYSDEQRYSRRRRRRRQDRDQLILSQTTPGVNADYYFEKTRELKTEVENLQQRLIETESRLKTEQSTVRNKVQVEIAELGLLMEDATQQNNEFQKIIKKQAKQLLELQSYCDEIQRNLNQALDDLIVSQKRCGDLSSEIDSLRSSVDSAVRQI